MSLSTFMELWLWCIIYGESTPFGVDAPANASINLLKKRIHNQNKNTFRDIDVKNLDLWKVGSFYRPIPYKHFR
jgi:Crinkler effector protein N-terminal domain